MVFVWLRSEFPTCSFASSFMSTKGKKTAQFRQKWSSCSSLRENTLLCLVAIHTLYWYSAVWHVFLRVNTYLCRLYKLSKVSTELMWINSVKPDSDSYFLKWLMCCLSQYSVHVSETRTQVRLRSQTVKPVLKRPEAHLESLRLVSSLLLLLDVDSLTWGKCLMCWMSLLQKEKERGNRRDERYWTCLLLREHRLKTQNACKQPKLNNKPLCQTV